MKAEAYYYEELLSIARETGIATYMFKRSALLPRIRTVLGIIKGLYPDTLVDLNPHHIQMYRAVGDGGYAQLQSLVMDCTDLQFPPASVHTVTMLEVLEHIPEYHKAFSEAVRIAQQYMIFSVPSHSDDNPEHINLFTKNSLYDLCSSQNITRIEIQEVPGHFIGVITL